MSGRLLQFLDDARNRVACGAYATAHRLASNGSLAAALTRSDAVIAELKPRTPSEGRILNTSPAAVLEDYAAGGAAAISVLTDSDHFDGSLDLLAAAHATGLPTLMKDFIVDTRQLDVAVACGASAVLLIERCLEDRESLVAAAHERGLEVLLEVHGMEEARHVLDSAAELIGVNTRDLDTLQVDVDGARDVIRFLAEAGKTVVALSGIQHRDDVQRARGDGAQAVLVGTHLVRHPDRVTALRALRRPVAKVCGITDDAGLDAAIQAGADLAGFIVGAPDSPRAIGSLRAQQLAVRAQKAGLSTVLVTPHEDAWEVREWCRVVKPNWVQLHRLRPDAEWIHSLKAIPTHVLFAVGPEELLPEGDGYVLDAPTPGSGEAHDWQAAQDRMPRTFTLIAGGLAADNAAQAVATSGAWGADASSRLESDPGIKDPAKVAAFVRAVQEAR